MKKTVLLIALTLIAVNALVLYSIRPYGYNVSALIRINEFEKEGATPRYFQKGMVIFQDGGYDGQAYYYVAMDPFLTLGHFRDAYRQQRVFYPLLSRALALGDSGRVPFSMYAVNLLALAAGMFFFIRILGHYSLDPAWSLLYGLSAPSIMTIQYDLPSPLSIALLIAAVYFYVVRGNLNVTAFFFALAFLTREDSIVIFLPLLAWDAQKTRSIKRGAVLLSSLVPFFLWQYFITVKLGALPTGASAEVISPVPFSGILGYLKTVRLAGLKESLKELSTVFVFIYFLAVTVVVGLRLIKTRHLFYYVAFAYCVLSVFTVPSQWNNYNGLLRMFYGLFPFLALSYAVERDRAVKYAAIFSVTLTVLTVVRILFISPVYPFRVF